jgi:hypothetical protein
MNQVLLTGYLPMDTVTRVCPTSYQQKLCFKVVGRDSKGMEISRDCVIEDAELFKKYEPILDRGRAVVIRGESTDRPVLERGRLKFFAKEIRVLEIEVPNRSGVTTAGASREGDEVGEGEES